MSIMWALGTELGARAIGPQTVLYLRTDSLPFSGAGSHEGPKFLCDLVFWVEECVVHTTRSPLVSAEPDCQCWETPSGFFAKQEG